MRRFPRPSPSVFAYWKRSKTGGAEGLGTRLHHNHVAEYYCCTHFIFACILILGTDGSVEADGEKFQIRLEDVLMFTTASPSKPPLGFIPTPSLSFEVDSPFPRANTCTNTLYNYSDAAHFTGCICVPHVLWNPELSRLWPALNILNCIYSSLHNSVYGLLNSLGAKFFL